MVLRNLIRDGFPNMWASGKNYDFDQAPGREADFIVACVVAPEESSLTSVRWPFLAWVKGTNNWPFSPKVTFVVKSTVDILKLIQRDCV